MLRTTKIPFIQSHASLSVLILTLTGIATITIIPFTPLNSILNLAALPSIYFAWLALIVVCYMLLATLMKNIYKISLVVNYKNHKLKARY
jgi:Mg2+-importing ATPase